MPSKRNQQKNKKAGNQQASIIEFQSKVLSENPNKTKIFRGDKNQLEQQRLNEEQNGQNGVVSSPTAQKNAVDSKNFVIKRNGLKTKTINGVKGKPYQSEETVYLKYFKSTDDAGKSIKIDHQANRKEIKRIAKFNLDKTDYVLTGDKDYPAVGIIQKKKGLDGVDYFTKNKDHFNAHPGDLAKVYLLLIEAIEEFHKARAASGKKYVHADIKLENILIDEANGVLSINIIDLGMVKQEGKIRQIYCGTRLFTAPEILSAKEKYKSYQKGKIDEKETVKYLAIHDHYSLATSMLHICYYLDIKHNFLEDTNKKLLENKIITHNGGPEYMTDFASDPNKLKLNAISELICEKPSLLDTDKQVSEIKKQLDINIKNKGLSPRFQALKSDKQHQKLQFIDQIDKLHLHIKAQNDLEVTNKTNLAITELTAEFQNAATKEERASIIKAATKTNNVFENAEKFSKAKKVTPKNQENPKAKDLEESVDALKKTANSSGFKKELSAALLAIVGAVTFAVGFVMANPIVMGVGVAGFVAGGIALAAMGLFRSCSSNKKDEKENDLKIVNRFA